MSAWTRRRKATLVIAAVLFAVVTTIRFETESVSDAYSLLYVLPITMLALELGSLGGLAAAALAMSFVFVWVHVDDVDLSIGGYLTRGLTFGLLGGLVGLESQLRRRAEAERERLLAHVEALARTDPLTGLANRRAWDEALGLEMERARRSGSGFAVALLDLDHFKQYNDRHGHPAGDALLAQAGEAWRSRVRAVDTVARYGGEEFAVLLPACPPGDAAEVVERVRAATPMGQTVSAGIAHWNGRETGGALIERADRALYAAKAEGRDRFVLAGPD